MPEAINFVKHRRKLLNQRQQLDQKLLRIAAIGLGVVFVLFLVTVGSRILLQTFVGGIKRDQETQRKKIVNFEDNERSFVIFIAKLNALVDLFDKRRNKQEAITFFTDAFGSDVLISDITYEADESILSFGLQSRDVFVLEKVFQTVQSDQVRQQFERVSMSELQRAATGNYQLLVTVVLKSGNQGGE